MQRLSAASVQSTGQQVTIFSYQPRALRETGIGADVADAREVLADPALDSMNRNIPDHFSDHFRVEGLAKSLGVWIDLDLVFLKPWPQSDYVLGRDGADLCGAILGLPHDSPILLDYLAICRRRPLMYAMPWFTRRQRLAVAYKRLEKLVTGKPPPRLHYGPPTLEYLARKHALKDEVAPPEVYYPVSSLRSAVAMLGEGDRVSEFITANTRTVHLWQNIYQRIVGPDHPKPDTWLGRKCRELAI
ncbi:MAG: hypothetical protein WDN31_05655 [Hyphomicrobium sp.]